MLWNSVCKKPKILHITPHLGGGAGKVLLGYLSKADNGRLFDFKVACLDYANENAFREAKNFKIKLFDKMASKEMWLVRMIAEADIVVVHWWNNPLLYDFLVRVKLPACRVVFWSHVSGFNAPHVITQKILRYPDMFVFTTPISFDTEAVKKLGLNQRKSLRVIWPTCGVDHVKSIRLKRHQGFNIGYIGTVDYAKLHPDFLRICSRINIPNVKFIVCGGSNEKEIRNEAEQMGIAEKFIFTGFIWDIKKYLRIFDVLGYPLAPYHYGACDQVLVEAMAAGIVPVTLNNPMEKNMINTGVTGIVSKDERGYVRAIENFYNNQNLKETLSKNAKKFALEAFSMNKMMREWATVYEELLKLPKTAKRWNFLGKGSRIKASDVFLESLGNYGQDFFNYSNAKSAVAKAKAVKNIAKLAKLAAWKSKTKGSVFHYHAFFPNDKRLASWCRVMKDSV